jgi:hypothetical protein
MNEGLGIFFDQFGNPISSLIGGTATPPIVPEGPGGPDLVGIGGAILSDQINSELGLNLVSPDEGSRFIEEGIIGRDLGVVKDIIVDKVNNAPSSVKANIASRILGVADPALAQIAAVNAGNRALQVGGDVIQTGLQFGQEGAGALSDRIDDSRFDVFGIPSGALDLTGRAFGLGDRAIEGVQGIGQGFTGDVNVLGGNLVDQFGRPIRFIDRQIDRGVGALRNIFNLFGADDDDDRRDDDPPVTVAPGQGIVINQAQDSKPDVDPESIIQTFGGTTGGTGGGGGADASRRDFPTGGGNVVIGSTTGTTSGPAGRGFTPVQRETQRISDIMDRRRRGFSQGFNAGGLASIPKYLKGR